MALSYYKDNLKILKNIRRHQRSDDYRITSIDPTRGFLLSLYLDKPGWIDRIAQGKSIGFIIILIGISGFVFSIYSNLSITRARTTDIIADNARVKIEMENSIKNTTSYESKENILDEFIINYTGKLEWGAKLGEILCSSCTSRIAWNCYRYD